MSEEDVHWDATTAIVEGGLSVRGGVLRKCVPATTGKASWSAVGQRIDLEDESDGGFVLMIIRNLQDSAPRLTAELQIGVSIPFIPRSALPGGEKCQSFAVAILFASKDAEWGEVTLSGSFPSIRSEFCSKVGDAPLTEPAQHWQSRESHDIGTEFFIVRSDLII